jgi:hypothetical protein
MVDRRDADGSGDAREGMCRAVHFVRRRRGKVCFEQRELALQGGEVAPLPLP